MPTCLMNTVSGCFGRTPLLLAAACFVSGVTAPAAVLVSNVDTPHASPGYEFVQDLPIGPMRAGQDLANSFTSGNTATPLDSISVFFAGGFGSGFNAALYSDATGSPGTLLATLAGPVDPHAGGQYDYAPSGGFTMQPNTTYWAVFSANVGLPDKQFPIYTVIDGTQTGDPGWSIGDNFASRFVNNGTPGVWVLSSGGTPLQFSVNTSVVPEPSALAFLSLGIGALLACRRRK